MTPADKATLLVVAATVAGWTVGERARRWLSPRGHLAAALIVTAGVFTATRVVL